MKTLGAWRVVVPAIVGIVVVGVIWEVGVRLGNVRAFILLPPSRIIDELSSEPGFYLRAALVTGRHAVVGAAVALAVSLVIGAMLAASRLLETAAQPLLVLILVAPWVAYFTSLVAWLGAGDTPVYFLVALVTVPAFTFVAVSGMRGADAHARELLASVDASKFEVLWRLRLPAAVPGLFAAGRYVTGLALAAAYYGEGGNYDRAGLGAFGKEAAGQNNGPLLWASVFATVALGVVGLGGLSLAERLLLRWHVSQRSGSASSTRRWLP